MKSVTTILFVENDAVALTMYQKRLQREGFHVETAEDGIAALKVLSEMTPDVVILDLMLPKFSGRDVFDYMRADKQFKKVPVIIFSNAPRTEWPQNPESSPTRALPKSEANFSSLLELVREMTTAAAAAEAATPAPALPAAVAAAPVLAAPAGPTPVTVAAQLNGIPEPAQTPKDENNILASLDKADTTEHANSAETAEQFLEYATAEMAVVREHCLAFIKGPATDAGRNNLSALRQRLQALAVGAQKSKCARLALLAAAWETLLVEIERKPTIASPSVLQTLAQAADCLRILINSGSARSMEPVPKAKVLSVDDDEICNHVAVSALERSNMHADSVLDANAALELLKQRDYDMVLLDVNMPGLSGFELCEKLRAMPHHQKTPVIFVTAFNNFENRKQSVLSGGGDLIAKPVSPLELALKVTIHLLKAPPKTVTAPQADAKPEPALVWKEPVETISHDSKVHRSSAGNNGAPQAAVPAPQARAVGPGPTGVEAPKLEAPKIEAPKIEAPKVEPPTPPLALKPEAAKSLSEAMKPAAPIPAQQIEKPAIKAAKSKPVLESVAQSPALPEKETVAPTQPPQTNQPPRTNQPAPPLSTGGSKPTGSKPTGSKPTKPMNKETNQQFETLVLDVAHIIFGDNAPEINVRLVRMAMEQVWQNRANLQSIDSIAREIARIIFGEGSTSDLNVRLVRMALERSNSIALFKAA